MPLDKDSLYKYQIVYQIYPRSFKDSDGDGIGDIKGIISKLDYLASLGITALWLSPIFKSPMKDGGYDISDYYHVDPIFGKDEDLFELIKEARDRGINIILDLVVNHTSDQHMWFQEALKGKDNPYHDYYVWFDEIPNDLGSTFGGSAYEYVESLGQYYLHLFAKEQPDLNWKNPMLREEIYKMMAYWLDKGVYGFRMDVIENLGKIPEQGITVNGPHLHEYIHEMAKRVLTPHKAFSVGECWCADNTTRTLYTDPQREELNMVFQFGWFSQFNNTRFQKFEPRRFTVKEVRQVLFDQQITEPRKSWNANFFGNHDLPRSVIYFQEDPKYRDDLAKMLISINLLMGGTPYIYQGEEIAMGHPKWNSLDEIRDVEELQHYEIFKGMGETSEKAFALVSHGRDNSRTPILWNDQDNAGFTSNKPWIKVNEEYKTRNVKAQESDPDSTLNFYRSAIRFRKYGGFLESIINGMFTPLYEESETLFAFHKDGDSPYTYIANWSIKEVDNPIVDKSPVFSHGAIGNKLLPYGFALYKD